MGIQEPLPVERAIGRGENWDLLASCLTPGTQTERASYRGGGNRTNQASQVGKGIRREKARCGALRNPEFEREPHVCRNPIPASELTTLRNPESQERAKGQEEPNRGK